MTSTSETTTSAPDGTLDLDAGLIRRLREALLEGRRLPELVAILRPPGEAGSMSPLLVMNHFMKALDLRFVQVRRMPGAPCLGGESYTDEEVDALLRGSVDVAQVARLLKPQGRSAAPEQGTGPVSPPSGP